MGKRVTVDFDIDDPHEECSISGREPHERAALAWFENNSLHRLNHNGETRPFFDGKPYRLFATGWEHGYIFTFVPEYAMTD